LVDLARFVEGIPPTTCVYLDDSYSRSTDARLLSAVVEKNVAYLTLDKTVFHPRSGGQPSDRGNMVGSSFRMGVKRAMLQGRVIVHYGRVEGKPETGPVTCLIDWAHRFLMMRRHTAAHLLDYCLAAATGAHVETTDSWLGDDPYVGYGGPIPSGLSLTKIQDLGNSYIQEGLPVEIKTLDRSAAEQMIAKAPNLSRLPKMERLRIVTIEGQIPIPCGGTHVRNLNEIGSVEVRRTELVEVGFRLHFEVS